MLTQQEKLFFPPPSKKIGSHNFHLEVNVPKKRAIFKSWSFLSAVLLWGLSFAMMRVALTIH